VTIRDSSLRSCVALYLAALYCPVIFLPSVDHYSPTVTATLLYFASSCSSYAALGRIFESYSMTQISPNPCRHTDHLHLHCSANMSNDKIIALLDIFGFESFEVRDSHCAEKSFCAMLSCAATMLYRTCVLHYIIYFSLLDCLAVNPFSCCVDTPLVWRSSCCSRRCSVLFFLKTSLFTFTVYTFLFLSSS
jgi:hypothetical protein